MNGGLIQTGNITGAETRFNLSRLASGTYWMVIKHDGQPETTIKIILTK
jgi:hypothetical protein